MTYSNPNYIPLDQINFTESNEDLAPDRRSLIMAPIIHYECAVKYHSNDEGLVNEEKVLELAQANKAMIANGNEQAFVNLVIEQYGEFLASN
tara:strand:- start:3277 stop:3552 length:276 start_codon:yes stop_codon:yes gene_type:complete